MDNKIATPIKQTEQRGNWWLYEIEPPFKVDEDITATHLLVAATRNIGGNSTAVYPAWKNSDYITPQIETVKGLDHAKALAAVGYEIQAEPVPA